METIKLNKKQEHKEPIIGELAIFWDDDKDAAIIGKLIQLNNGFVDYRYCGNSEDFRNAILFESIEQYKEFVKG
jgi:hypothetical protein